MADSNERLPSRIRPGPIYTSENVAWREDSFDRQALESSLVMSVGLLEALRGNVGTDRLSLAIPGRPGLDFKTLQPQLTTPKGALRFIDDDPEFDHLWGSWHCLMWGRTGEAARKGRQAHAEFLVSAANPTVRIFAATPLFQAYVSEMLWHNPGCGPGPYFYKVLEALGGEEPEVMGILGKTLFEIGRWDQAVNWLEDRSQIKVDSLPKEQVEAQLKNAEEAKAAQGRFRKIADTLFSIMVDTNDQSPFKQFLLDFFPAIDLSVCDLTAPPAYNPEPEYQRILDLFGYVSQKDWKDFADYILVSQWYLYDKARVRAEEQIRRGNLTAARAVVSYHQGFQDPQDHFLTFYKNEHDAARYWADQYAQAQITEEELAAIPQQIKALRKAKELYLAGTPKEDSPYITVVTAELDNLRTTDAVRYAACIPELARLRIFPTKIIVQHIAAVGLEAALKDFAKARKAAEDGGFNPQDPLQRDLEYLKFLRLASKHQPTAASYSHFLQLPTIEEDSSEATLDYAQGDEADAASFETAQVYWLIRERAQAKRRLIVVGNQRYGDYFVLRPMESELGDLGEEIRLFYAKIGSSGTSQNTVFDIFPDRIIKDIVENHPDLVIVDGTCNPTHNGSSRFPNAMLGYLNWVQAFNAACEVNPKTLPNQDIIKEKETARAFFGLVERLKAYHPQNPYLLSFWDPQGISENVILGGLSLPRRNPQMSQPEFIIVNSTVAEPETYPGFPRHLREHKPGLLDDPDKVQAKPKLGFTKIGVEAVVKGLTEQIFVRLVQERMERSLPHMIRLTDPVNRDI